MKTPEECVRDAEEQRAIAETVNRVRVALMDGRRQVGANDLKYLLDVLEAEQHALARAYIRIEALGDWARTVLPSSANNPQGSRLADLRNYNVLVHALKDPERCPTWRSTLIDQFTSAERLALDRGGFGGRPRTEDEGP